MQRVYSNRFTIVLVTTEGVLPQGVNQLPKHSSFLYAFMPYEEGDSNEKNENKPIYQYVSRALTSQISGAWLRVARRGNRKQEDRISQWKIGRGLQRIQDASKTKVICKLVRGQLAIPMFKQRFSPLLIHVRRDPRAVIASFIRSFDTSGWEICLEDQLLGVQDGRISYFSEWAEDIKKLDREGFITRLAAYWAFTEKYVSDLKGGNTPDLFLRYENLCLKGSAYIQSEMEKVLPNPPRSWNLHGSSASDYSGGKRDQEQRIMGWKNELSTEVINRIEAVVNRLGMSYALDLVDQY